MNLSKTDDELKDTVDEKTTWKMLTGNKAIYPTYRTLKDALIFLHGIQKNGRAIGPLAKSDDSVYVSLQQIQRLWKLLKIS